MMKAEEDSTAALMKVCGLLPAAMQGVVLECAKGMQVIANEHAATVAKLEAQTDAQRGEIETMMATNAKLKDTIGALGDRNQALEQEISSLRELNGALIAERSAYHTVEAAVAQYTEEKRRVDALLQVADAVAPPPAPRVVSHADLSEREASGVEESVTAAPSGPEPVVKDDAQSESAGDTGAGPACTPGKAGGRRVAGGLPVPS